MADNESDLETYGLELALDTLCLRYCSRESSLSSKDYCSKFCELVEEYTGQWQVPLPQLKVLRTALCSFTRATAGFPDDCQNIQYVLSSLALSFFELMLFFSKEEFVEEPLKDILDSFQECHFKLLRHRNIYLQHLKQVIKGGGPWENPVLQGILKEADLPQNEVEDFLSSELPIFLELRVRYLQACERIQEAMTLAKSCLENHEAGQHLYFHQAYLTCLYKASLYENLNKEMAEIDGRDAVEIICNTESVEKDELLLSLCKAFLTRQLHNGDMYYIWDLVFIWSRLYLRAHPSRQGFLTECLQLASSATNVRAIFPFIKLVTTELGNKGVEVCVELCARALQLCDKQADTVTQSLVCKTIAFLLPHDLEICRACALLVFCQERSLEAYRTVCLLYMHPDQEANPDSNPVRTNVRFHILQMLKERLCFDPEFWNLLTLRTHCLELMSDKVTKDAVLSEMKEEEERECTQEYLPNKSPHSSCILGLKSCHCSPTATPSKTLPEQKLENGAGRKVRAKRCTFEKDEMEKTKENKNNLHKPTYSLRRNHAKTENSASLKLPLNRKREYLSRCVKSQILKRKGRKRRWLEGLPRLEQSQAVKENIVIVRGRKRGRKPLHKLELSYPDNEMNLEKEGDDVNEKTGMRDTVQDLPYRNQNLENQNEEKENKPEHPSVPGNENGGHTSTVRGITQQIQEESPAQFVSEPHGDPPTRPQITIPLVEANPELDGPLLKLLECPIELLHNYSLLSQQLENENEELLESKQSDDSAKEDLLPEQDIEIPNLELKPKTTWRDRVLRTQKYGHLSYRCNLCCKTYKGLNVMRHAISHLKNGKPKCILCGKRFKQFPLAKKHVLDHIDEMCKQKPPDKEPTTETTPAANGIIDNTKKPSESHHEGKTSSAKVEASEQKPKGKPKLESLTREERIIRNVRILLKKTSGIHKKDADSKTLRQMDFKDEQVTITDDLIVIKEPFLIQNKEGGEDQETPAGENGCSVEIKFHLCPSDSCDKVFMRLGCTLMKHALKCHVNEEKVLEKTFLWSKRRCSFCLRQIHFYQHYKDHVKLHGPSLPYFCYHLECTKRYAQQQELKDHVKTHQPFRPHCQFTDCEKLFSNCQGVFDHEWRHYVPAPQKEELEPVPTVVKQPSSEAPWKQRVKIEEIWLQSRKVEGSTLDVHVDRIKAAEEMCRGSVPDESPNLSNSENCFKETGDNQQVESDRPTVNGCEDVPQEPNTNSTTPATIKSSVKKNQKKVPRDWDVIDVKEVEDVSTLAEGIQKDVGEPHITEHKTFKPEDPAYAPFVKAPFIRPPPSTYLDESVLSMPKRRASDQPPPKKYYNKKNKPTQKDANEVAPAPKQIRHRCDKCLSSFNTSEELQKHQTLNTCSSLFGFDSDDES
ncbi:Zinc finger protein 292 [Oryzias melastigma]|uniref:Zinc finger protein 292 n=1 Tax=Oryzias melastigma TaxID=30732 RepID=A0A834F641_ORYME|nr:Zinc finger protein 292 [Oryzias melastigma]